MAGHVSDTVPTRDRGQLYLDFVVGIGVFMVALAFVVSFAPGLFSSFPDDPAQPLVADRSVDRLAGPVLGANEEPAALNSTCASAFFTRSGGVCGFDGQTSVTGDLGIESTYRVNVSLARPSAGEYNRALLCIGGDTVVDCDGGDPTATAGNRLPNHQPTTATALRTVTVDGRDATLVVRVW